MFSFKSKYEWFTEFQGQFSQFSRRTFIYDIKENSWIEGPSLLAARARHSSCAIQSDDGSIKSIIAISGNTDHEYNSETTELLDFRDKKWVEGPDLPLGIRDSACVALPPTSYFACIVVGGEISEGITNKYSSNVYGLNKSLDEWTLLGKITRGRSRHIALPLS